MSTPELLRAQARLRDLGCRPDIEEKGFSDLYFIGSRIAPGGEPYEVFGTADEIREELSKRPHIPSKKEGKLLRKLQSKTGVSEQELRANSHYGEQLVDVQHSQPRKVITKKQAPWYQKVFGSQFSARFKVKG